MLVNCPECSSPVFVRSAAIEQRKPQRCYSCQAQLLVGKDGAVEIAVEADPDALSQKKGEGLLSASPEGPKTIPSKPPPSSEEAQPTKVLDMVAPTPEATVPGAAMPEEPLDLSDEAIPIEDDPEPTTDNPVVNAIFGGSVSSGDSTPPTEAVPAPAPISFGDLDVGPVDSAPDPTEPELPTAEPAAPAPAPSTDPEGDSGWPTMISKTPFASPKTGGEDAQPAAQPKPGGQEPPHTAPETTLAAAEPPPRGPDLPTPSPTQPEVSAEGYDSIEEPTAIGDPRQPSGGTAAAPEQSAPSWQSPSTQAAATDVHDVRAAVTLEPSEEASDEGEAILEPEPYEPTAVDAEPPAAEPANRFSITGEDSSSGSGEPAPTGPPAAPPNTDADVSSPFSAAMGGPVLEGDFLTAGTLVRDVPEELIARARQGELTSDDEKSARDGPSGGPATGNPFGAPGGMLGEEPLDPEPLQPHLTIGEPSEEPTHVAEPQTEISAPTFAAPPSPDAYPLPEARGVATGSLHDPPADIEELEPMELDPMDEVAGPGAVSDADADVATVNYKPPADAELLPHDSSPYVHQPKGGPGLVAWAGVVVVSIAAGLGAAWLLQPEPSQPTPLEELLLTSADQLEAGEHREAIDRLEAFLTEEPNNAAVQRRLAVSYALAGDRTRAEEAFLRYLEIADDEEDKAAVRTLLGLD